MKHTGNTDRSKASVAFPDYPPPPAPLLEWMERIGFIEDSWKNDTCPAYILPFGADALKGVRLVIDHEDPDQRETLPGLEPAPRYGVWTVIDGDVPDEPFETDDMLEAAAAVTARWFMGMRLYEHERWQELNQDLIQMQERES